MSLTVKFSNWLMLPYCIIGILLIHLIIRLGVVLVTDLGNDEVYYVNYALFPDWSYFDHPPMVGWMIWLTTLMQKLVLSPFFVRLGALIIGTLNLWIVYRIGYLLKDRWVGNVSALLLSSSFYSSIIVGTFVLPDTPLSIFWLLAVYFFLTFIKSKNTNISALLLFGLFVGFAALSKYFAIFLWLGIGVYAWYDPRLLKNPFLYLSALISILVFTPVIHWNLTSNLSGLSYHASRVGHESIIPNFRYFFPEFLGQIFYNNPINFTLIIWSLFFFIKEKFRIVDKQTWFLIAISLPLVIITLLISMYNRTLPHWSGVGYFGLTIAAVNYHATRIKAWKINLIGAAPLLFVTVVLVATFQIETGRLFGDENIEDNVLGKDDFTVDLSIWNEAGDQLNQLLTTDLRLGRMDSNLLVITHKWFPAAHLDYYFALNAKLPLLVNGDQEDLHQYLKINNERGVNKNGYDAYYITTSHYYKPISNKLKNQFDTCSDPVIIPVTKYGTKRINLFVWRLTKLKSKQLY